MTSSRSARPEPGARPRPSDERARLAADGRTTRRIALGAMAIALAGVGLAAWGALTPAGGEGGCQQAAWDTAPRDGDLPAGWSVSASQYDIERKSMTLAGPLPQDESAAQAIVYATITCYPSGAADSVARSAEAVRAAGQEVTLRDDLGDQAFSAFDTSNSTFLQLRHGNVVVYLAASGDATASEVDMLASAFDKSLGGDGGSVSVGTPDAGASAEPSVDTGALPSDEPLPSESAAAPELEAKLPDAVGDVQLGTYSALGSDLLGEDAAGRPVIAALRAAGAEPRDLRLAQAYDGAGTSDLVIWALAVDQMDPKAIRDFAIDAWQQASGPGITREPATVGGREVIRVDYGGQGVIDYVFVTDGVAYIVSTSDPDLAAQAVQALP